MTAQNPEDTGRNRRMQRRVDVGLPVVVLGTDSEGQAFQETAQSSNVSRTGASFVTTRPLEVGMEVELIISRTEGPRSAEKDFNTRARVMRVSQGENPRERIIGVHFLGPRFHRVFVSEST